MEGHLNWRPFSFPHNINLSDFLLPLQCKSHSELLKRSLQAVCNLWKVALCGSGQVELHKVLNRTSQNSCEESQSGPVSSR